MIAIVCHRVGLKSHCDSHTAEQQEMKKIWNSPLQLLESESNSIITSNILNLSLGASAGVAVTVRAGRKSCKSKTSSSCTWKKKEANQKTGRVCPSCGLHMVAHYGGMMSHFPQHFPAGHAAHCAHPPVVSVLADLPETLPEMRQRLGDSSDSDRKSWLWHALAVTNRWTLQNTSKYIKIVLTDCAIHLPLWSWHILASKPLG